MENKIAVAKRKLAEATEQKTAAAKRCASTDGKSVTEITRDIAALDDAERLVASRERDLEVAEAGAASSTPEGRVSVTREARTYERGNPATSFFSDLYKAQKHQDPQAFERLRRNEAEWAVDKRASGTTETAGFLPPIWMADEWAELARPGRPVADRMRTIPMPADGLTAHIPKVSTGLTVAAQTNTSGVNDDVASADLSSTTVDAALVTCAGQTDVDRQVLERSLPGLDMVLFDDLLRAYDAELDRQLINGATASEEHLGILNVSGYNPVSAGGSAQSDYLLSVYQAVSKVHSTRFLPPTAIYMHPRRAAWLASYQSSSAPVFQVDNLYRAIGGQDGGIAGSISGLPVIIDANVPTNLGSGTNEDWSIVSYEPDFRLAEDDVRQATFEEVLSGKLQVRLQLYSFGFFFPHRYPQGISVIKGYAAPTGF